MMFKIPKKIKSVKFKDNRGYFQECFKKKQLNFNPVFSAISMSKKNVIRGMHLQLKKKQEIFLTVVQGKIYDVCIDINKNSKNFKKKYINELSEGDMMYIPKGFAHGFATLEKENLIMYQFSKYRHQNSEIGIMYDDKDLNIKWPVTRPIISKKDKMNMSFSEFKKI
jgi:dTDP-4-dehydrorhamnose 3,5-epimerase